MAARQGRGARRRPRPRRCARSPRACAWSPCCCTPWMPESAGEAARRARHARPRADAAAALGGGRGRSASSRARAAVPQAARDRQPHAPRHAASRRTTSSSPRRRRGGVTRMLTVGMDDALAPRGARGGRGLPAGLRRDRPPPQRRRRASTTPTSPSSSTLAAHARCVAIGETGLDFYRDYAPRARTRSARSTRRSSSRAATGKPLVIHTRAAEDDTIATLPRTRRRARRDPALLLDARPPRRVPGARAGGSRSPATSPTRRPQDLAVAAARVPAERLLVETDAPYLTPQVVRKERNQPAYVAHTARFVAERRGVALRGARARSSSATPPGCSGGERAGSPTQPSLRRARASSASGPSATSARTS